MDIRDAFRPDGKQALAVVAMVAAVFTFSVGEVWIGIACFIAAAIFSLGGLFWNAHRADRAEAAAAKTAAGSRTPSVATEPNKE